VKGLEYFRVQSNIAFDNDLEHVSDAAFRTFIELIGIAAHDLSDGQVANDRVMKLCNTADVSSALHELNDAKYIRWNTDEVVIKEFTNYQRSRQETLDLRGKNRDRVRAYRTMSKTLHTDYTREQSKSKTKSKSKSNKSKKTPPMVPPLGDFNAWYKLYPRKVARAAAERAWAKAVKKVEAEKIVAGLEHQLSALKAKDKEYIPHPATWLNQERWDDEVCSPSVPQTAAYVPFVPTSDDEVKRIEKLADFREVSDE